MFRNMEKAMVNQPRQRGKNSWTTRRDEKRRRIESVRPWMQSWGAVNNPAYTATNVQPQYLVEPHVGSSIYTPGGVILQPAVGNTPAGPLNNYAYYIYGIGHHTEDDCRPEDAFMQV